MRRLSRYVRWLFRPLAQDGHRERNPSRAAVALAVVTALLPLAACEREDRPFRVAPPAAATTDPIYMTDFRVGPATQPTTQNSVAPAASHVRNEYEENAWAMAEGKRLYSAFNCNGCHAHGGGDKGPPLMDDKWIYGWHPEQVFASIIEGRPNGMPSFRGRIPDHQAWQLSAYVRSMAGLVRKDAAPGRSDSMKTKPPEHSIDTAEPKQSTTPPAVEMPQ